MVEQLNDEYERAFDLAVIGLNKVPGLIQPGELSLDQRKAAMDALWDEGASRQERAFALEQMAVITEDEFFLRAARRAVGGRGTSDSVSISTRRF